MSGSGSSISSGSRYSSLTSSSSVSRFTYSRASGYTVNGVPMSGTRFGYSLTRTNNWPISRIVYGSTYTPYYYDNSIPENTDVSSDVVISDQYLKTSK